MKSILLQIDGGLMLGLIIIAGSILGFLVLREIFLWYWKVNEIVANQQKQIHLLSEILKEYRGEESKVN